MAGTRTDPQANMLLMKAAGPSAGTTNGNPGEDLGSAGGAFADEKATAKAKRDRAASETKGPSLGDALALGAGQQSTPYQLETQADAIARQIRRGDV